MAHLKSLRKKVFGNPIVVGTFVWLFATYLKFCRLTSRFERRGFEKLDALMRSGDQAVLLFWHQRTFVAQYAIDTECGPVTGLNSSAKAGRTAAAVLAYFGFGNVDVRSRGKDSAALRDVSSRLQAGDSLIVVPDGSRGPARVCSAAPVIWARYSQLPVYAIGISWRWRITLPTWDKMWIPLPFSRGVALVSALDGGVNKRGDAAYFEERRKAMEDLLDDITDRTDRALGLEPEPQPEIKPVRDDAAS